MASIRVMKGIVLKQPFRATVPYAPYYPRMRDTRFSSALPFPECHWASLRSYMYRISCTSRDMCCLAIDSHRSIVLMTIGLLAILHLTSHLVARDPGR